ncbi:hypothetical protein BAY60_25650 [Prauserella muralis]|uniref:Recombinase domain-containing protein n=1 Tax=Prauserella muralis TaxID=588067 RepID=A0A2V4AY88_9PSEU|nr:hypothetical protein BAY60_25650 [Prauserella muralis]
MVAVDDSLDSSSQMGRAWMQMSAVFAELDLNTMKERITATRTHLRKMGRWVGGQVPYGYRPVKDEDGYHLEHDPETAPVVREIVERVLLGHSVNGIARDLTDRKVPPPRAGEKRTRWREETGAWSAPAITAILRSPALRGWVRYKGKPVLGPDGLPRSMGPELVTAGEWELVQEALEARSKQRRAPRDAGHAPLFGVVHCACGSHMVSGRSRGGERRYVCLRARRTPGVEPCPVGGTIMGPPVEEFAEEQFLAMFGGLRVVEYRKIPGQDFSAEIRELEASLQRLDEAYQAGAYEGDVATYATMRKGVRAKLEDLRAQPTTEARTEEVDHGVTYGLMWELATDAEERRKLMLDCHFRVWVGPRVRQGRVSRDEVRARLSAGIAEEALLEPEDFSE